MKKERALRMHKMAMICGGESYEGSCKICGKAYHGCKTGSPSAVLPMKNGYCSKECMAKGTAPKI